MQVDANYSNVLLIFWIMFLRLFKTHVWRPVLLKIGLIMIKYVPSCSAGMRNFEIRSESLFKTIPTKCKLRLRIVCLISMFQRRMKLFYKKNFVNTMNYIPTERKLITVFNYQNQKINKKIIKQKRFLNLMNKIRANFLRLKPDATGTFRVRL
jgi:hypothetical protein